MPTSWSRRWPRPRSPRPSTRPTRWSPSFPRSTCPAARKGRGLLETAPRLAYDTRLMSLASRLLGTKSLNQILRDSQAPGQSLKRTLGPVQLTALGIGAVIGAGIFATVGTAAAGNPDRPGAGPAIIISFIVTAIACAFCALCYAELASLIPISGSAYTYAYATLGEMIAWIIGWDLIIEYAIGNVAVAISWSGYFNELLKGLTFGGFSLEIPLWVRSDMHTALSCGHLLSGPTDATPDKLEMCKTLLASAPHIGSWPVVFNLPAVAIVTLITV